MPRWLHFAGAVLLTAWASAASAQNSEIAQRPAAEIRASLPGATVAIPDPYKLDITCEGQTRSVGLGSVHAACSRGAVPCDTAIHAYAPCAASYLLDPAPHGLDVSVCAASFVFLGEAERLQFLAERARWIIKNVASGNVSVAAAAETPTLTAFTNQACADAILEDVGFADVPFAEAQFVDMATADAVALLVGAPRHETENTIRRCVLRFEATPDLASQVAMLLLHSGLRRVTVSGADGVAYVAIDDDCGLGRTFIESAIRVIENRPPPAVHDCETASLRDCGFPD